MASRNGSGPPSAPPFRARCRCGHFPTHHMVIVAIGSSAGYRMEPTGPCAICGEVVCRRFVAAPP